MEKKTRPKKNWLACLFSPVFFPINYSPYWQEFRYFKWNFKNSHWSKLLKHKFLCTLKIPFRWYYSIICKKVFKKIDPTVAGNILAQSTPSFLLKNMPTVNCKLDGHSYPIKARVKKRWVQRWTKWMLKCWFLVLSVKISDFYLKWNLNFQKIWQRNNISIKFLSSPLLH